MGLATKVPLKMLIPSANRNTDDIEEFYLQTIEVSYIIFLIVYLYTLKFFKII